MNKIIILSITSLFLCLSLYASDTVKKINAADLFDFPQNIEYKTKNQSKILKSNNDILCINLKTNNLNAILNSSENSFQIDNFPISPELTKSIIISRTHSIYDGNTEFWRVTNNGPEQFQTPVVNSFFGKIEGVDNSKVYLFYIDEMLFSIIVNENGQRSFISPVTEPNGNNSHILTTDDYSLAKQSSFAFYCMTNDELQNRSEIEDNFKSKDTPLNDKILEIKPALEASYDFFNLMGKNEKSALAHMTAIMACVEKIYEVELNVIITVPYVYIWEDENKDPYKGLNDAGDKLSEMPSAWKDRASVARTNVCLFAALHPTNGYYTAGISYLDEMCNNKRGYTVFGMMNSPNLPTMIYTSDVSVSAHELGHMCGSPHTHNCYFQPNMIDTCITSHLPYEGSDGCVTSGQPIPRPGTIMSYCHLTNSTHSVEYTFGDRVRTLIRRTLENDSNCIKEVTKPTILLINPIGNDSYQSGTVLPIKWSSKGINNVSLLYSTNNGAKWVAIAGNLPAGNKLYNWTLPNIQSNSVILIARDLLNPLYADTSIIPIAIHSQMLSIKNLFTGSRFGYYDPINVEWDSYFVDSVYVEFSFDNGDNWEKISPNISGNIFQYFAPDTSSNTCKIRLRATNNDSIISYSDIFAVGMPQATILSPNGGEKICAGTDFDIKWQSDFLSSIMLDYSLDNGQNWKKVSLLSFDAKSGIYAWKIPNKYSDSVLVRVYSRYYKDKILDESNGMLEIDSCLSSINQTFSFDWSGLRILSVIPNPLNTNAIINIGNSTDINKKITLKLINEQGALIKSLGNYFIESGLISSININIPAISQGSYYLLMEYDNNSESYNIKIIR